MSRKRPDSKLSATEIEREVCLCANYLMLVYSLIGTPSKEEDWKIIKDSCEWGKRVSNLELKKEGPKRLRSLKAKQKQSIAVLKPLKPWREISQDYADIQEDGRPVWDDGLDFGWVQKRFDISGLRICDDLPYHARLGTGIYAQKVALEENYLLRDAFRLLVRTRHGLDALADIVPHATAWPHI